MFHNAGFSKRIEYFCDYHHRMLEYKLWVNGKSSFVLKDTDKPGTNC